MVVKVVQDSFGTVKSCLSNNVENVRRFTISNDNISVQVITYGATIFSLLVPDVCGTLDDITLGYDDIEGYQTRTNPYIGGTIGRVCSRVGNGSFTIGDKKYEVSRNFLGKHQLHGGFCGFDKVNWKVEKVLQNGVVMSFLSPDGHEGYPGKLKATVTYTVTDEDTFQMSFDAVTTKPTPCNITNHAYFNLGGHQNGVTMKDHMVMIMANKITDMDEETVPNGKIISLDDHPLDLRKWKNVGKGLKKFAPNKGYDHNYILDWDPNGITLQAKAYHPPSGRWMEISSNQPCMHFYTSHNMPDVRGGATPILRGKDGAMYMRHGSFCMETHWYPDAVNHENFPSVILYPGKKYNHTCIFRFGATDRLIPRTCRKV